MKSDSQVMSMKQMSFMKIRIVINFMPVLFPNTIISAVSPVTPGSYANQ